MLRLHNLQRARFLEQQAQNITTKAQMLKSNSIEFESFKVLSSKIAESQLINV